MVVLQTTVAGNGGPRTYNTRNVGPTRPLFLDISNVGPGRTYKTENDRTTITADLRSCNITYRIATPGISGPSLANSDIERTSFMVCLFHGFMVLLTVS